MDLTIHSKLAAPADAKIVLADQTLPSGEFATVFNAPGPVLTHAATPRSLDRDTAQPFADRSSGDIAPSLTDGDDVDAPAPEISQPVERGRTPSDRELQVLPTPTEQQKPVGSAAIAEFAQPGASGVSDSPQRDRTQPASTDVLQTRSSSEVTIAIAAQTAAAIVPLTPSIEAKQSVLKPQAQSEPLDTLGKLVLRSAGNVSNTSERHFQPILANGPALDPASIGKTAGMATSDIRIQTANVSTASIVADIQQAPPQPQPGDQPSPETLGTKTATHSALTSLERHLGGHPATLVPDLTRQTRAPLPELGSMRFAVDGSRSGDANLITSHIITAQPRNHAPMTIAGTVPTAMMVTAAPTTPLNTEVRYYGANSPNKVSVKSY